LQPGRSLPAFCPRATQARRSRFCIGSPHSSGEEVITFGQRTDERVQNAPACLKQLPCGATLFAQGDTGMNSIEEATSPQPARDPERLAKDSEQLARMEQAAQSSSDPQAIKECRAPQRQPASHADKVWLAAVGTALLLLLAAQFFLNW